MLAAAFVPRRSRPPRRRATPPAPPPPACATPQHRQFDFWVGSWDVYPPGTRPLVAHSLIERRYDGCAIRENWMPLRGQGGGSFSAWRPGANSWRQTWVDSSGAWVEFTGGMDGDAMVLTGPWAGAANGRDGIVRMRYSPERRRGPPARPGLHRQWRAPGPTASTSPTGPAAAPLTGQRLIPGGSGHGLTAPERCAACCVCSPVPEPQRSRAVRSAAEGDRDQWTIAS